MHIFRYSGAVDISLKNDSLAYSDALNITEKKCRLATKEW